eukprot:TRINITY_DN1217_c0_g2_i18.p1 TRINITY_DN1217_c0_g2~~TRINITY_DN1217_c0_g2_i18.p1  ORF type:complete len:160 (+),score=25.82 TRINITY_DN1217_c0_g2_i18:354-833(+)
MASGSSSTRRKWAIDFNQGGNALHYIKPTKQSANTELKLKKAWEVAKAPGKGILMTAFMLWMAGSGIHIFSIMITGYSILNPIKAIFGVSSTFSKFSDGSTPLFQPKIIYILLNLLSLSVALYKCSNMGLLPTAPSDWISMLQVKQPLEYSTLAIPVHS